jgi:hypothetical protein
MNVPFASDEQIRNRGGGGGLRVFHLADGSTERLRKSSSGWTFRERRVIQAGLSDGVLVIRS